MSISRFSCSSGNTNSPTLFYNFLNTKKTGTFLEDVDITLINNTITLSKNGVTISFTPRTSNRVYQFKSDNFNDTEIIGNGYYTNLTGAILCNNGIIIQEICNFTTGNITRNFCITTDSKGELAIIRPNFYNSDKIHGDIIGVIAVTKTSTAAYSISITNPIWGSQLTSLAPFVPTTIEGDIYLDKAFICVCTQINSSGLNVAEIDGTKYITNGYWYIKD